MRFKIWLIGQWLYFVICARLLFTFYSNMLKYIDTFTIQYDGIVHLILTLLLLTVIPNK